MASADPSATRRAPILLKALTDLRSIGPNTAASAKFVYEGPDAESREVVEATTQGKWLVVFGSLLPKPTWYGTRPVKVTITFDTQYPIEPPTIRLITPLFHPNVDDDGEICCDLLTKTGGWLWSMSLIEVINQVTAVFEEPSTSHVLNERAAQLFAENRQEFERQANQSATTSQNP